MSTRAVTNHNLTTWANFEGLHAPVAFQNGHNIDPQLKNSFKD